MEIANLAPNIHIAIFLHQQMAMGELGFCPKKQILLSYDLGALNSNVWTCSWLIIHEHNNAPRTTPPQNDNAQKISTTMQNQSSNMNPLSS